ncbi:MAG: hypothetical protein ACJ762_09385 [Solirubrobacteraceae bacterium]
MGLLDDAIREHLELKRRRGADTAEVARQEQEAFGPVRRGDLEDAPAATATAEPEFDEPAVFDDEPVAPTALHVVEDPQPVQDEPSRPHGDPATDAPAVEPEPEPEHFPVEEEPPRPHGDPADALPHTDQPTRAFDAEEVRAATTPPPVAPPAVEPEPEPEPELAPEAPAAARPEEEEGEGEEDVLEETPEFLQETPEHDRLWFEQRPPRDFDF